RPGNHRHHGADLRHLADIEANFGQCAGGGRWYFHRGLVGLDLKEVVAWLHSIAGRLEPFRDLALGNGFAELRHQNIHASPLNLFGRPYHETDRYCVSRNSIMPSCGPSRPRPDCLVPPNGAAGSETRPRLRPTMPKSSFSETRMPRVKSFVYR